MTRNAWLIVAAVGGASLLCCLGSGVLLLAGAAGGEDTAGASASTGGSALEGTWLSGSVSLTSYRNVATGAEAPPSGTGELLALKPGGSCERALLLQSTVYSCTSSIFVFSDSDTCEWSLDGDTLSVETTGGALRTHMCGGEVKEGEAKPTSNRWTATVTSEAGQQWLTLTSATGETTRLRRER